MADIYKMDTDYLSAESVYDRTLGKKQSEINSKFNQIGTYISESFSVAVDAKTTTDLATVVLPAGYWILFGFCDLTTSVDGVYIFTLGVRAVRQNGSAGGGVINMIPVVSAASQQSILIRGYAPVATTMRGQYCAFRLK